MSKLIIGCGYLGSRLAGFWIDRGEEVFVTTRSVSRAETLEKRGFKAILLDVTQTGHSKLPSVETVIFSVGFDRTKSDSIHDVYVGGLRNVLKICPDTVQRFVYISSTGVYGQINGDWVDEKSECRPNRDGGKACLAAEELLRHHPAFASKAIVLRLAGIYGPDRLPQVAMLKKGESLQVADDAYLNLVHVEDIVRIIAACERLAPPPGLLCVSDGQPVIRGDFYHYLAELLGTAPPTFEALPSGSPRAARSRGSKRIRNSQLVATLDAAGLTPRFLYPSYREGLTVIVGEAGG